MSGSIGWFSDERCVLHRNAPGHPESPERLIAVKAAITANGDLQSRLSPLPECWPTLEQLHTVHDRAYVSKLLKFASATGHTKVLHQLDEDTYMGPHTMDAAMFAAGAGLHAVEVADKYPGGCFLAVRPPGHHALRAKAMGFCLFNNVAVAAQRALQLGHQRVLIVDFDVHHGNGTQEIFYHDPRVCFVSLQRCPQWPGTGRLSEDGAGPGKGYNVNIPLPPGSGNIAYLEAFKLVDSIAVEYAPELILVSAGYDAHRDDPIGGEQNGGQRVSTAGFAQIMAVIRRLSFQTSAQIVTFLEGGYNPSVLADSIVATLRVQSATSYQELRDVLAAYKEDNKPDKDPLEVARFLRAARAHHAQYWRSLR